MSETSTVLRVVSLAAADTLGHDGVALAPVEPEPTLAEQMMAAARADGLEQPEAVADFAIDDFGAGYSGLNLLAGFQPNFIKLDLELVTEIHHNGPRQAIVRGVMRTCLDLGIEVIAEGIEHQEDFDWLWSAGVRLFQGYLLARPEFETLPEPYYPPVG